MDFDSIIVGAGPAGALCANLLKQSGIDVLVIDKKIFPRSKCCSGLLSDRSQGIIKEIYGEVPENILVKEKFLDLTIVDCQTKQERVVEKEWLHIDRSSFDNWLIQQSGAEFLDRAVYISHREDDEKVNVTIRTETGLHTYTCKFLIDASGGYSKIRRTLQRPYNLNKHAAAVQYSFITVLGPNFDTKKHYYFIDTFSDIYGWAFMQNGLLRLGITYFTFNKSLRKDYLTKYLDFLQKNNYIQGNLEQKSLESALIYASKGQKRYLYNRGRVFFIGESSGLMTGVTEGISQALISARELAKALIEHSDKETIKTAYESSMRKEEDFIQSLHYL